MTKSHRGPGEPEFERGLMSEPLPSCGRARPGVFPAVRAQLGQEVPDIVRPLSPWEQMTAITRSASQPELEGALRLSHQLAHVTAEAPKPSLDQLALPVCQCLH